MVIGKSIGGGDQMQELDETDTMIETIKKLGETRITRITKHSTAQSEIRRARRRA